MPTEIKIRLPFALAYDVGHMENTSDGQGRVYRKDGEVRANSFVVTIDAEALVKALGRKALKSKARVTQLQNGAVTIKPTDARRIPVGPVLDDEKREEHSRGFRA